jgi:hypothetical protein
VTSILIIVLINISPYFNVDKSYLIPSLIPYVIIRGSMFALDAVVYDFIVVYDFFSLSSCEAALCCVEKTKCDKYSDIEGARSAAGGPGGGCARRPDGTHSHLLVVGVGNPIAVLGLAPLSLGGVKSVGCDLRIRKCREAS